MRSPNRPHWADHAQQTTRTPVAVTLPLLVAVPDGVHDPDVATDGPVNTSYGKPSVEPQLVGIIDE